MTSLNIYSKEQTDNLLSKKEDKLTFDNEPTEGSTNPVTSDGIYMSLEELRALINTGYIHYGYVPPENPNIGMFWYNNIEGKLYICVGVVGGVGRWSLIVTSEGGATWGNIQGDVTNQLDLMALIDDKQDKLTAGTGIAISGNEISSTVPVITVDNVADATSENPLQNKVITQQLTNLNSRKQDKLTAGDNITIDGNNVISATLTDSYTKEETDTLLTQKQDNLTQTQLSAVNSGINASKVSAYDSYESTKQGKLTAGTGINITSNNVISATGQIDAYTKSETDTLLSQKQNSLSSTQLNAVNSGINASKVSTYDGYATGKQNKLTAGTNITIDSNNVISASGGGGSYSAGNGIRISNDTISARAGTGITVNSSGINVDTTTIQEKITNGDGIQISNNTVSAKLGDGLEFDSNGAIKATGGSSDGVKSINSVTPSSNGEIYLTKSINGIYGNAQLNVSNVSSGVTTQYIQLSDLFEVGIANTTANDGSEWYYKDTTTNEWVLITENTSESVYEGLEVKAVVSFSRTYAGHTPLVFLTAYANTTYDDGDYVYVQGVNSSGFTAYMGNTGYTTIYYLVIPYPGLN